MAVNATCNYKDTPQVNGKPSSLHAILLTPTPHQATLLPRTPSQVAAERQSLSLLLARVLGELEVFRKVTPTVEMVLATEAAKLAQVCEEYGGRKECCDGGRGREKT